MSSVRSEVVGVLGRPVIFQWKVNKGNSSYVVAQLSVFNGSENDDAKPLFSLRKAKISRNSGISTRLNALILGNLDTKIETTYQLTLNNVQYNDVNTSFYLSGEFAMAGASREEFGDTVKIIEVNGTCSLFVFLSYCVLFA